MEAVRSRVRIGGHYVMLIRAPGSLLVALLMTMLLSACDMLPLAVDTPPDTVSDGEPRGDLAAVFPTVIAPIESDPPRGPIVLLVSSRLPAYLGVAQRLSVLLGDAEHRTVVVDDALPGEIAAQLTAAQPHVTVAIGLPAALLATDELDSPVVFCQVFNYRAFESLGRAVGAVSVLPAFSEQLRVWKALDSGLSDIGVIVGSGHEDLLAELHRAGDAIGLTVHDRISNSDQETSYLFKRLASEIDGFLLVPDNRVLSVGVIKDLLQHANERGVSVIASNPELLALGAAMSITPTAEHIAESVYSLLGELEHGIPSEFRLIAPIGFETRRNPAFVDRFSSADRDTAGAYVRMETADE